MDKQGHAISLILLAHNEELNIANVLRVLVQVPEFDEILVIADACTDNTVKVAQSFPTVKILERPQTKGKGDAMIFGVSHSLGDIIMFCDADIKNFTTGHVYQILEPVINGRAIMSVGRRDRIFGLAAIIPKIFPLFAIAGERAMTKEFFDSLPRDEHMMDFGIETVMNYYIKQRGLKLALPRLKNLRQIVKERKWNLRIGLKARIGQIGQVRRTRRAMKQRIKKI